MKTETATNSDLKVSEETANLVGCLKQMNELYSSVYSALEKIYGAETAESLIDERFFNEFKELEKCISRFLCLSISDKIGRRDSNEI